MKKSTKYIAGGCAFIIVTLVSVSLFSSNPKVKYANEKILRFLISLRNMDTSWTNPKGEFVSVYIESVAMHGVPSSIWFKVPADKMKEFEKGYRDSLKNAVQTTFWNMWRTDRLWIETTEGKYEVFIMYTDEHVLFENGLKSKEFRRVLNDAGFEIDPTPTEDDETGQSNTNFPEL